MNTYNTTSGTSKHYSSMFNHWKSLNTVNVDNTIKECIACSSDCISTAGCGGPLGILDIRGCYECQTVILQPFVNEVLIIINLINFILFDFPYNY